MYRGRTEPPRGLAGARGVSRHRSAHNDSPCSDQPPPFAQLDMEDGDCIEAMMQQARRGGVSLRTRSNASHVLPFLLTMPQVGGF